MKRASLTPEQTAEVVGVLQQVMDPCSVAAGNAINIVDFGLVTSIEVNEDRVLQVTLRSTFPGCTMIPHFAEAAEQKLASFEDFSSVEVRIDRAFTWSPAAMTAAGRRVYESRGPAPVHGEPWALSRRQHEAST